MAGKEDVETLPVNILREVIDIPHEISFEEIAEDINSAPPDSKIAVIEAYLKNVDGALTESFDTGEWFKGMIELRNELQGQLDWYTSLEFKVEGLDEFLGEVKTRLIERMQAAHDKRGNDWLWRNQPQEAQEEYLDAAAYSVLLLRRLTMGGIVPTGTLGKAGQEPEPPKTSLESKLSGFDNFTQLVKQRIIEGDQRYGDSWLLMDDQPQQIKDEVLDTFAYAYFGWRRAKMIQTQSAEKKEGESIP